MPKAKFVLKEPKATDDTLVYLFFNFNYQRLKYSTGEKIHPKFWNASKQRVKETSQFPQYSEFNTRLTNIDREVENCYRKLINDGIPPSPDVLKIELDRALKKEAREKKQTLFEFIEKFIEQVTPNRKIASIRVYKTALKHLKEFSKAKRRKVDFDTITLDFYHDYVEYLTKEKGFLKNTEGKNIKTLKMFLNEATERGINKNMDYKSRKFKGSQEDIDHIYLTTSELEHLYNIDLSKKKSLERVRDLFLVGCHTGLRFSDFTHLKDENFVENSDGRFFHVRTQKTKEKVVIPIKPTVWEIWNKYNGKLPRAISNQKMNDYLKDLGKEAEFTEKVVLKRTSGNEAVSQTHQKFELVSTHTARRSFATNAYKAGIPSISIMKITGHRTDKAFMKYIKISQEENATMLVNHSFFYRTSF